MHLAPLTGIETEILVNHLHELLDASRAPYGDWNVTPIGNTVDAWCISRPLRGLKQIRDVNSLFGLDASRAPYGDWNRSLNRLSTNTQDASRAPYGDWNVFYSIFLHKRSWCISRPLQGLKLSCNCNLYSISDASRAPYGDWNLEISLSKYLILDASRAPYGDWNGCTPAL